MTNDEMLEKWITKGVLEGEITHYSARKVMLLLSEDKPKSLSDKLLTKIYEYKNNAVNNLWSIHYDKCASNDCGHEQEEEIIQSPYKALSDIVEFHKPIWDNQPMSKCICKEDVAWPCSTIQFIEKYLNDRI